jgi:hypothetical protein
MDLHILWSAIEAAFAPPDDAAGQALMRCVAALGLQAPWFRWFSAAALFGPERFTTADYMRMFPYGLPVLHGERLAAAVQAGRLTADGQDGYRGTEDARAIALQALEAMNAASAQMPPPLPDESLRRLTGYLARVVDAALAAPGVPAELYAKDLRHLWAYGWISETEGRDAPKKGGLDEPRLDWTSR